MLCNYIDHKEIEFRVGILLVVSVISYKSIKNRDNLNEIHFFKAFTFFYPTYTIVQGENYPRDSVRIRHTNKNKGTPDFAGSM